MWERVLDTTLNKVIRQGRLRVTYPGGATHDYGEAAADPVHVTVHDEPTLRRLALSPDPGMGEAYMDQTLTIENDDLEGLLTLAMSNVRSGMGTRLWQSREAIRGARRWIDQKAPAHRARANVSHHYDLSGQLYELFLDADRQYSCAYFPTGKETLEEAQEAKKHLIASKLLIEQGMRVLDIGCGWGGMAITLARDYGAEVVGITLSEEQHKLATERVARAGLSNRIEIRLQDYRRVNETFDRIVSVGMFEHVGLPHYREYFQQVHDLLAPDGIALIHTIGRSAPPAATSPWIAKYIFPGGYIPSLSEVATAIEREELWLSDVEVLRLHYAETLRHWYDRFMARIDEARALYDDRFCRMWRYYLKASEVTFRVGWQAVFQVQLARRVDAVPVTRDYLFDAPRSPLAHSTAAE